MDLFHILSAVLQKNSLSEMVPLWPESYKTNSKNTIRKHDQKQFLKGDPDMTKGVPSTFF